MPRWEGEASSVERARELLRELDGDETAAWNTWAGQSRAEGSATVADAARDVAHDVERLRAKLLRFVNEYERAARTRAAFVASVRYAEPEDF